jgi:hypothetical protein
LLYLCLMRKDLKNRLIALCFCTWFLGSMTSFSQVPDAGNYRPSAEKEKKFLPYMALRHGGLSAMEQWKSANTVQYYQELWYYSESFYIERNHLPEGATLDEGIIDISRFESQRKQTERAIVILPGFRDALVLLSISELKFKPVAK